MTAAGVTLPDTSPGATVNADNPWPGLLAFSETDKDFFQGRQIETEQLFRLTMRERLTILLGLSGLGKSSLLRAGLFPKLRKENYFPIYIRLDYSSTHPDLAAQVCAAIAVEASLHTIEAPLRRDEDTLWEYFHRDGNSFWNTRNKLVVPLLVFDQFEEIFTLGRIDPDRAKAAGAFLDQLADLSEGRPPVVLKEWIDNHPAEASAFDFGRHHYKLLLGIREDFLANLEACMPTMARNRFWLRSMNGDAALLVVNQARHLIDPEVGEQLVRFVAADRRNLPLADLKVEPALLSVVCRELNNRRVALGEPRISAALLEVKKEEVLADFYERSMADLAPDVRSFLEDHLITDSGYRDNVAMENALSAPGVSRDAIDRLVERRLVRQEDRGGTQRLELTHDLLAGVVRASRDKRRVEEAGEREQRALLQAQERQQQALLIAKEDERLALEKAREHEERQRERRDLRRFRIVAAVFLVLTVISIALAIWAVRAQQRADLEGQAAKKAELAAEDQLKNATTQHALADSQTRKLSASLDLVSALGKLNGQDVEAAVESQPTAVADLLPRVYIQIVDQGDRDYAGSVKRRLTAAGVLVLGIQYVAQAAATQSRTDVRYYRKTDEAEAGKIVDLLKAAGQGSAYSFIPSGQENNPKVRPNHFEVWLANGSGSTCQIGYVWREATPADRVCVTPSTRDQTASDNVAAASRRAGDGPYGPDTCQQGFVWRGAFPDDHVCVSTATRAQASADNAAAQNRIVQ